MCSCSFAEFQTALLPSYFFKGSNFSCIVCLFVAWVLFSCIDSVEATQSDGANKLAKLTKCNSWVVVMSVIGWQWKGISVKMSCEAQDLKTLLNYISSNVTATLAINCLPYQSCCMSSIFLELPWLLLPLYSRVLLQLSFKVSLPPALAL